MLYLYVNLKPLAAEEPIRVKNFLKAFSEGF